MQKAVDAMFSSIRAGVKQGEDEYESMMADLESLDASAIIASAIKSEEVFVEKMAALNDLFVKPFNSFPGPPHLNSSLLFPAITKIHALHAHALLPHLQAISPGTAAPTDALKGVIAAFAAVQPDLTAAYSAHLAGLESAIAALAELRELMDKETQTPRQGSLPLSSRGSLRLPNLRAMFDTNIRSARNSLTGNPMSPSAPQPTLGVGKKAQKPSTVWSNILTNAMKDGRCKGESMMTLLAMPALRVAKYRLIVEQLVVVTPPGSAVYDQLLELRLFTSSLFATVEDALQQSAENKPCRAVQDRLKGTYDCPYSVSNTFSLSTRQLVSKQQFMMFDQSNPEEMGQPVELFLFLDSPMLIIAETCDQNSMPKVSTFVTSDLVVGPQPRSVGLSIKAPKANYEIALTASSAGLRDEWVHLLTKKTFGSRTHSALDRVEEGGEVKRPRSSSGRPLSMSSVEAYRLKDAAGDRLDEGIEEMAGEFVEDALSQAVTEVTPRLTDRAEMEAVAGVVLPKWKQRQMAKNKQIEQEAMAEARKEREKERAAMQAAAPPPMSDEELERLLDALEIPEAQRGVMRAFDDEKRQMLLKQAQASGKMPAAAAPAAEPAEPSPAPESSPAPEEEAVAGVVLPKWKQRQIAKNKQIEQEAMAEARKEREKEQAEMQAAAPPPMSDEELERLLDALEIPEAQRGVMRSFDNDKRQMLLNQAKASGKYTEPAAKADGKENEKVNTDLDKVVRLPEFGDKAERRQSLNMSTGRSLKESDPQMSAQLSARRIKSEELRKKREIRRQDSLQRKQSHQDLLANVRPTAAQQKLLNNSVGSES